MCHADHNETDSKWVAPQASGLFVHIFNSSKYHNLKKEIKIKMVCVNSKKVKPKIFGNSTTSGQH